MNDETCSSGTYFEKVLDLQDLSKVRTYYNVGSAMKYKDGCDKAYVELLCLRLISDSDSHPNVIRLTSSEHSGSELKLRLAPCCTSPIQVSVEDEWGRFSPVYYGNEVSTFCRKLGSALMFIHSLGIYHRDVTAANILMSGHEPILCDFSESVILEQKKGVTECKTGFDSCINEGAGSRLDRFNSMTRQTPATYSIFAPECCVLPSASAESIESSEGIVNPSLTLPGSFNPFAVDVWGLGLVLRSCLLGSLPLKDPASVIDLFDQIAALDSRSVECGLAEVDELLCIDPKGRMKMYVERYSSQLDRSFIFPRE